MFQTFSVDMKNVGATSKKYISLVVYIKKCGKFAQVQTYR